ncbi:MAG: GrpB family protein [bacterium]|nr:GrpB family protein [bacterium]
MPALPISDNLKTRIKELVREEISIVPYNPAWPKMFEDEAVFLRNTLPQNLIKRIEHFGSTAVLGLSAKPIIDILVEVASFKATKSQIVPILKAHGYEYFWRPAFGDNGPPYYAWFIKRGAQGRRTHHIHMIKANSKLWDRLYFRDYLRQFPQEAKKYDKLKRQLSAKYPNDRVKYTAQKTSFILSTTAKAKKYFQSL